jgi:hypothetical protein
MLAQYVVSYMKGCKLETSKFNPSRREQTRIRFITCRVCGKDCSTEKEISDELNKGHYFNEIELGRFQRVTEHEKERN